ncbi:hypothetical protein CLV46_2657 [Diaminobutyricimonas aerilata]|uniref:DNA-directed RNA polymerase subunit beta n=1 Tax=Diaminobutyricimonas aerilata TaxID=1162967 RepID=A0A2M9CMF7_9MICO|nr:DNA-directed RNA polymerase subunit beta [Diaminobutyricimonas aerilata]PJJ73075.1 hypothetical protein CLV46_2657 [Diaminobutyricimonas aerilata]
MSADFHKPTKFSTDKFESYESGNDPATILRIAHDTAHSLVDRVRDNPEPDIVERLVEYTDTHGIDALAELWARSSPRSLPGALWRIYLLRVLINQDPEGTSTLFQRGSDVMTTIDPLVAGASMPTGPAEIRDLADEILRGVFRGDFAVALDRAASFCRVAGAGAASIADDSDATAAPERASELTSRALRYDTTAAELTACARLWRRGELD